MVTMYQYREVIYPAVTLAENFAMDIRDVRRSNLRALMDKEFGIAARGAQSRLAEKLGKPQNFVSRCLADPDRPGAKTIGEDFAREIEEVFRLPRYAMDEPGYFSGAASEPSNVTLAPQPSRYYRYPVVSSVVAGGWGDAIQPYEPGAEDEHELTDYMARGPAFWLKVDGDSMTSPTGLSIPEGMYVLVDTGLHPQPGDLVVAKLDTEDKATFKRLVSDAGQLYLKPLNPAYRMIAIDGNCRLIGVVKEAKMKL